MEAKEKKTNKPTKKPIEPEKIVKFIQFLPIIVSAIFLIINISKGNVPGIICISICEIIFTGAVVIMITKKISIRNRELVLAFALPLLVFMISLFSGESYSDDFPLYLAVIAIVGLFLEPSFTKMQVAMVDVLLIIMYAVHPEKGGELGQYILCYACFNLAAWLYYMVINRGRAFISLTDENAMESVNVLASMKEMGDELQKGFDVSSERIKTSAQGLQSGSAAITEAANEAAGSCVSVRDKIKETEYQIDAMNEEVRKFEEVLSVNKDNIESMNDNMTTVDSAMNQANDELANMEVQMKKISGFAKQLSDISYNLTILALNASVEAGRAGKAGAGFGVVADNMRELAQKSDMFSEQVEEAIGQLIKRVGETKDKFEGSKDAMGQSVNTMSELSDSFESLREQFESLYGNIEEQNYSVSQINYIFDELNGRVSDMHTSSLRNQRAVDDIIQALDAYSESITGVIENTRQQ